MNIEKPWVIGYDFTRMVVHEESGKLVCTVPRDDKHGRPYLETLAITMTIRAAPEMYAALLEIAEMCEGFEGCPVSPRTVADKARKAIARARIDATVNNR